MTGYSEQLAPEERKRRAAAVVKAAKLVRRLGFRQVAGRPGFWYHQDMDQESIFCFTGDHPVESIGDIISHVYYDGVQAGEWEARNAIRKAIGV